MQKPVYLLYSIIAKPAEWKPHRPDHHECSQFHRRGEPSGLYFKTCPRKPKQSRPLAHRIGRNINNRAHTVWHQDNHSSSQEFRHIHLRPGRHRFLVNKKSTQLKIEVNSWPTSQAGYFLLTNTSQPWRLRVFPDDTSFNKIVKLLSFLSDSHIFSMFQKNSQTDS